MMQFKPHRSGIADISDFSGNISTKGNSFIGVTKIVIALSILLAVIMVVSK